MTSLLALTESIPIKALKVKPVSIYSLLKFNILRQNSYSFLIFGLMLELKMLPLLLIWIENDITVGKQIDHVK